MVWTNFLDDQNPDGRVEAVYDYDPTLTLDELR